MPAHPATLSYLHALWLSRRFGRLDLEWHPDAVTDTTRRRKMRARRIKLNFRAVRVAALGGGLSGDLKTGVISLPSVADLYSAEAHAAARKALKGVLRGLPAWWKLELGKAGGGVHVHFIAPAELAIDGFPEGVDLRFVWNLDGLACYLAKPHDGRAARSNNRRAVPPEDQMTASNALHRARAGRRAAGFDRLAPLSGFLNVPRAPRKPSRPVLALRLTLTLRALLLTRHVQVQEARHVAHLDALNRAREARAQQAYHCPSTWCSRSVPQRHPQTGPQGQPSAPQRPIPRLFSTGPP